MKKGYIFLLSLAVLLSGCCKDKGKKGKKDRKKKARSEIVEQINVPVASDEIRSYFDDSDVNLGEFVLVEDEEVTNKVDNAEQAGAPEVALEGKEFSLDEALEDDFSWVQELENEDAHFKTVYFEFDKYDCKADYLSDVQMNIETAKRLLVEGGNPTIVIEGHSCHAAGSGTYNLALSEKRAKVIADRFIAAGIPGEHIKIVARGQDCPAKDASGDDITGSQEEQWQNRRAEVRIVYG